MGTIFLFHSSRAFSTPWSVNAAPDLGFTLFDAFISGWIMPLFFVISGVAVYFSIKKRNALQFCKDRFLRLMVPFLTVGLFVILPVNAYYDAVFHGEFQGNFLSFYLGPYFKNFFPFTLYFSATYFGNSNEGIYLWYLFWLFVFSLITFPLFRWIARDTTRARLAGLYAACNRRGGLLLLAIPIILVNIAAIPPYFIFPSGYGGWKLPTYLALFITAYIIGASPDFEASLEKNRLISLISALVTSAVVIAVAAQSQTQSVASDPASIGLLYVIVSTIWALNGWCWVIAFLGYGRKYLSLNHTLLSASNELVLPFYVLHQAVIVAVAFYVVGLDLIAVVKYLLIVVASLPIILAALYPISKINVLRFLFGMRTLRKLP